MKRLPDMHEEAADQRRRRDDDEERGPLAVVVGDGRDREPAEEAAEEEDVEADERERLRAHAVRNHRGDRGPDLGERGELARVRDRHEHDERLDRR